MLSCKLSPKKEETPKYYPHAKGRELIIKSQTKKAMAKVGANSKKQENGISLKLKTVVEMHQKSLDHLLPFSTTDDNNVPKDVKQGYLAVIAEDDYELKRFVTQ